MLGIAITVKRSNEKGKVPTWLVNYVNQFMRLISNLEHYQKIGYKLLVYIRLV